jgi:hypothetical protein
LRKISYQGNNARRNLYARYDFYVATKPSNPAAELARMRAAALSPERRREIAEKASVAAAKARKKIPAEKRREIARKAAAASAAVRTRIAQLKKGAQQK